MLMKIEYRDGIEVRRNGGGYLVVGDRGFVYATLPDGVATQCSDRSLEFSPGFRYAGRDADRHVVRGSGMFFRFPDNSVTMISNA